MHTLQTSANSFNSRTPGGVRLGRYARALPCSCFNSRTPGGVRPGRFYEWCNDHPVSIHAPREGCDFIGCKHPYISASFNSRTPGGVRLSMLRSYAIVTARFNSRTPGGVRLALSRLIQPLSCVSIHAPREGCDITEELPIASLNVSIHAPREGCD